MKEGANSYLKELIRYQLLNNINNIISEIQNIAMEFLNNGIDTISSNSTSYSNGFDARFNAKRKEESHSA